MEEEIKEKLKIYFPESDFKISYDSEEDVYEILSNNETNDICLLFKIENDHIIIEYLSKCKTSGKDNLSKIEHFATTIPSINYISLEDNSVLLLYKDESNFAKNIIIKLYVFFILCNNESWYNTKGYKSKENHIDNQRNNFIQLNKNIIDFLIECFHKYGITDETKIRQLLSGIQLFTSINVRELSVQHFFNIVKGTIISKPNCDEDKEKYKWLREILDIIDYSELLQYDKKLTKDIVKKGGKKKKRRKTRKTRKTKQRKQNKTKI
jgi:hypothetical protein